MYDRYNRQITYMRISVTDRCNLRCTYCMPSGGIPLKSHDDILSYESIAAIVQKAAPLGITKIRLTGGEPLVRKNIEWLIPELKGIPGIREVAMTTNGVLLTEKALILKQAGLDRLNISLDTIREDLYKQLTRNGNVHKVLEGIDAAKAAGFKNIKINMVVMKGVNDHYMEEMTEFCRKEGLILQRINHYVLDSYQTQNQPIEFERPLPCSWCNRIRLTADGRLKPCLCSDIEIKVDMNNIEESVTQAIRHKPPEGKKCTTRGNWQIGG
ncbi:MAG: radical SAM protein [Spirochaetales bacterium]|nr:radical SAM protein [Spirochaetales bacterium]